MKKHTLFLSLVFSITFISNILYSQENNLVSSNINLNTELSTFKNDRQLWKENATKRTIYTREYVKPDGKIVIEYSKQPINYFNSNRKLEPINLIPSKTSDGDLFAQEQKYPVILKRDGSITIKLSSNEVLTYCKNVKINNHQVKETVFIQDTTHAVQKDIIPGVDKTFDIRLPGVKYSYVINKPIVKLVADLEIEEEIKLAAGAKITTDLFYGKKSKNGWEGDLSIISKEKTEIGRIFKAVCYDSKGSYCLASYKLEEKEGIIKLKMIVPNSWINDGARVYPITIDPLVTGPTATYVGPNIPSCDSPLFGSDSILVTIPAQITVTGLFVSGSFYADIFGGANKTHGAMVFKTKCGKTPPYIVNGSVPTATLPGAAIATDVELKNPLTCCIPQSCTTQTFYVVMQISRTYTPGVAGCNEFYIYHNAFDIYPFKAYIEGHTTEQGLTSTSWKVQPSSICSNVCQVVGTVYMKYGTPPYTITHPWNPTTYTVGTAVGCSSGFATKAMTLTVPDCPTYCGVDGTFSVPTPTVIDACGNNAVVGLLPVTLSVVATPTVSASPNPAIACHDVPFNINLNSCIPTSTISWSGNGATGSTGNNLTDTILNLTGAVSSTTYIISANNKGCISEPYNLVINTDPKPIANYSVEPEPSKALLVSTFTDASTVVGSTAVKWAWSVSKTVFSNNQTSYFKFDNPGAYNVCLAIESEHGCRDTLCRDVNVIVASITLPNVITPNGDGVNDFLKINYLDFFGTNNLKIYDRWGKLIYEKQNYDNKWNGDKVSDGTFFLVLVVDDKSYSGFLQVFHK